GVSIPSAPGYVGVFHYAAVLAVEIFDVPRAAGLGYALLFHASQVIPITLVGWLFLLREHLSLGEAARAQPAGDSP
ncbi:MAG: flippase-like domain-containing protein, partial [Candidatus Rokubacteria bacterium]|nr:flippase-like domain-containing protein [Candidatus Rokubacteria bacterium]